MSGAGRPPHSFWERGNFHQIKVNNKKAALCNICKRVLENTTQRRLAKHVINEIMFRVHGTYFLKLYFLENAARTFHQSSVHHTHHRII
jgi:hypothetical protein